MTTQTSNIDDILLNATQPINTTTPPTAEELDERSNVDEPEALDEDLHGDDNYQDQPADEETGVDSDTGDDNAESQDEYGNEENAGIRKRLSKQAQKYEAEKAALHAQIENLSAQVGSLSVNQKAQLNEAVEGFEHDPNASGNWEQQLAAFVENTVSNMGKKTETQRLQQEEAQHQAQFEARFKQDVTRFPDFEKTIRESPGHIDDVMVYSTRSMKNPAAFLYAAAKRAPQELQRISNLRDPYAKIAAMGALEASLRQSKTTSKAPKPMGKIPGDNAPEPKKYKPDDPKSPGYIENLIAKSDAKRKAQIAARRR